MIELIEMLDERVERACIIFSNEFELEASQHDDEVRYTVLKHMALEFEEELGVPHYVLGMFALQVH